MSRQRKACRDNEKQIFLELHNSQFFLIKQHSKLGAFTHTNQNILVKTHLIILEPQLKYEKSHCIVFTQYNSQNDIQNTKKNENNKATIHFLL